MIIKQVVSRTPHENEVFALRPAKLWPLLAKQEVYANRIPVKPCGPVLTVNPASPALVHTAIAVSGRTTSGAAKAYSIIILFSAGPIFFPRYSGVRPTINPAKNTAIAAAMTML